MSKAQQYAAVSYACSLASILVAAILFFFVSVVFASMSIAIAGREEESQLPGQLAVGFACVMFGIFAFFNSGLA